jgi:hypothetical protein
MTFSSYSSFTWYFYKYKELVMTCGISGTRSIMHCTTDQTFVTKSTEHTHVHRFWINYSRHDLKARDRSHFTCLAYLRLHQSLQFIPSLFDLLLIISKYEVRVVIRAPVTFVSIKHFYLSVGNSTCRRGTMQHLAQGSTSKILFGEKVDVEWQWYWKIVLSVIIVLWAPYVAIHCQQTEVFGDGIIGV